MDFSVRTTDVRFLDVLNRYLGDYRVDNGPRDIVFSADCGVEKELAGGKTTRGKNHLYFQAILIHQGNVIEEMAGRLISGVRTWTNHHSNEFLRIRAGGVALDGGAVLLPSQPEPHLATVVALLVSRGARYIGDEIVNIDPVLRRAHGTGLPLLLNPEDLPILPDLDAGRPRPRRARGSKPRSWWPLRLEELHGSSSPPRDVRWIVFPTFRPGAGTQLRELGKADALFRFTQAGLNLHIWTERALALMQQLLRSGFVAELVVGDLSEGVECLLESLPRPS
jgi:hypothetical protein